MDFAKVTDDRTAAVGELVEILFADQDRSPVAEATHNLGVFMGDSILENGTSGRRARSHGVDDVFQPNRNAVHGTTVVAALDFLFGASRVGQSSFFEYGDERIKLWIQPLDAYKTFAREFYGRDAMGLDFLAELLYCLTQFSLCQRCESRRYDAWRFIVNFTMTYTTGPSASAHGPQRRATGSLK